MITLYKKHYTTRKKVGELTRPGGIGVSFNRNTPTQKDAYPDGTFIQLTFENEDGERHYLEMTPDDLKRLNNELKFLGI